MWCGLSKPEKDKEKKEKQVVTIFTMKAQRGYRYSPTLSLTSALHRMGS
jgi:hypothetical protein